MLELGKLHVQTHGCGRGFICIKCGGGYFSSCYFTPNEGICYFQNKIDCLHDGVLTKAEAVVVAGNFNARATSPVLPSEYVMEIIVRTDLLVLNIGNKKMFRRPGCPETIADISLELQIGDWTGMEIILAGIIYT